MMNLESRSCRSGFMLMEVLITLTIVGFVMSSVFFLQSNALRALDRYSDKLRLAFVKKNFLVEKTWKARHEKKQEAKAEQKDKITGTTLKYVRQKVKKGAPLFKKKIDETSLGNLCKQQVSVSFRRRIEKMINFLYKPKVESK